MRIPAKDGSEYRCYVKRYPSYIDADGKAHGAEYTTFAVFGVQGFRLADRCADREHCRFIRNMFNRAVRGLIVDCGGYTE